MRQKINFFTSYAHEDMASANSLLHDLQVQLAPSLRYDYQLWRDTMLLVGEDWQVEICTALADSQLGLLLLSPAFLSSRFITNIELPHYLNNSKPVIPVMLQKIDFDLHDLHGLVSKQIYRLQTPNGELKAFGECRSRQQQQEYARKLFQQIEARLDRLKLPS